MEQKPRYTKAKTVIILLIVVLVLVATVAIYRYQAGISDALSTVKLVPTPEAYTELYFNNTESLPTSTIAGKPTVFSFTIHNVEGTSTIYPYAVYFQPANGAQLVLVSSTVSLADGASTTIEIAHTFQTSNIDGRVVVDLSSLNQEIDFLLPNINI